MAGGGRSCIDAAPAAGEGAAACFFNATPAAGEGAAACFFNATPAVASGGRSCIDAAPAASGSAMACCVDSVHVAGTALVSIGGRGRAFDQRVSADVEWRLCTLNRHAPADV